MLMLPVRFCLFALWTTFAALPAVADPAIDRDLQDTLERGVASGLPGISAAIAGPDGVIWSGVAGHSDLVEGIPVAPEHLFGIGSITKTFVAVVALQLGEEGRLDLGATARHYLGAVVDGIPNADRATLLQLMNHTGGVPTWEFDAEWIPDGRGRDFVLGRDWGKEDTLEYLRDGDNPALNQPGAAFNYANTNYTLLGLVIEKVTGNDVTEEIRDRILNPMGVEDIYLDGFEQFPRERVVGNYHYATPAYLEAAGLHSAVRTLRPGLIDSSPFNLSPEWAAGGMVATASALATYAVGLASGKLLDARSRAIFFDFRPTASSEGRVQIGHGIFRMAMREGGPVAINHTGGVIGFSALMAWVEGTQTALVVLINVGTMHSDPIEESEYTPGDFLAESDLLKIYERLARPPD
jgi:D-alanyl-D-alanine carboxypeptidase